MNSWRVTATTALASASLAVVILVVALLRDTAGTPFGPGELDIVLTARSMAAGVWPPFWVGAVHPDAPGTWLGAVVLVPLLRLGVPDVVALKSLAVLHYALFVGASAGLAARRAGRLAGMLAGAVLTLGSPALVAAHSKYLATTVEIAGVEVAMLWAALELARSEDRRLPATALLGVALGLSLVYSLHVVMLLVPVVGALVVGRTPVVPYMGALGAAAVTAWLPFTLARDPLGPQQSALSVKTLSPSDLLSLVGVDDLGTLVRRAPHALLSETEHITADSALRALHVPLALVLAGTVATFTVLAVRRRLETPEVLLTIFGVLTAAPLLVAGDLLGYPAAYRYYAPVLAPAAILLGIGVTRLKGGARPRFVAAGAVLILTLPGLLTTPRATATELGRPMAAFFAGQHRLGFARHPLHTQFLMLTPFVTDAELAGWLQGYGLHVGREYTRQAPIARIERDDSRPDERAGIPDIVDRVALKARPDRWLVAADWLGAAARADFLLGVGLGIAEDGRLDAGDVELVRDLGDADAASVWRGVGAALGERWHWTRNDSPLLVEGDLGRLSAAQAGSALAGLSATGGPDVPSLDSMLGERLRPDSPVRRTSGPRLAHPHPFTYADVGVLGRGEVPMGPR